jgi:hypothetical protein
VNSKNGLLKKKKSNFASSKIEFIFIPFIFVLPKLQNQKMDSLKGKQNKRGKKIVLLIFSK